MENQLSNRVEEDSPQLNGGVTAQDVARWKAKYRKVYEIGVTDEADRFVGYFRRPDQQTMEAVNKLSKTDEIKGGIALFDNCWLGGDATMKDDFVVKMSAMEQLTRVFNSCVAELKNL
jgi:hypothetical protein